MYESHGEIFSQGESLTKTFDALLQRRDEIVKAFDSFDYDEIVFLACGSSYWASRSAYMTMQRLTGKKCFALKSGDVVMDKDYYKKAFNKPLLILPSRSGKTHETLIAADVFLEQYQSNIVGIVEYEDSTIKDKADIIFELTWANEISVCQTRSFSVIYLACVLIAAILANDEELINDLKRYLDCFDSYSKESEERILKIIDEFPGWENLVSLGCNLNYGVAIEGAYISIEMGQFPSNYYGTLEWRHGPIVMADEGTLVCITSSTKAREYEESIAKETMAKKARVVSISALDDFENADYKFFLGWQCADEIVALYSAMVMQGFAYHKAVDRNIDPDNPVELVPWISL